MMRWNRMAPLFAAAGMVLYVLGAATPSSAQTSLSSDEAAAEPSAFLEGASGPGLWTLRTLVPTIAYAHGDGGEGWAPGFEVRPLAILLGEERTRVSLLPGNAAALHAGSFEVFGGAWHRFARDDQGQRDGDWLAKAGVRGYMPLAREGRALSASVGAAYLRTFGQNAIGYELGLYGLSGAVGTTFTFSAHTDVQTFLWTIQVRPF
ncbi:MAG: hypothetical protein AAGH15_20240 [Myxococcota bacterium]